MSTPPKRPEKPSAVPPPAPRDSDKAPDEIIALGPQKENCTRLHFPLSSNARAQLKHSGRGKGTQRLHPVPATERAEAERDSGLLSSSACSLQLSLFGQGFGGVRVKVHIQPGFMGSQISMALFCWP